jgi:hypothetical protein
VRTITVFAVLAVVVVLTLSLSSCSVKTSGEVKTTTSAAPADTPAAPEAAAPAETESGAKVASIVSGDKFDEETKKITNEATTFAPDTPEIFVNAEMAGMTKGAKITGTLVGVDITKTDGTAIKDQDIKSTDITMPADGEATARFSFTAPPEGWPVGSYAVTVAVDGKELDAIDLTVEKATH